MAAQFPLPTLGTEMFLERFEKRHIYTHTHTTHVPNYNGLPMTAVRLNSRIKQFVDSSYHQTLVKVVCAAGKMQINHTHLISNKN
jgi:hypothetical protein